jgi:hypothetical protein
MAGIRSYLGPPMTRVGVATDTVSFNGPLAAAAPIASVGVVTATESFCADGPPVPPIVSVAVVTATVSLPGPGAAGAPMVNTGVVTAISSFCTGEPAAAPITSVAVDTATVSLPGPGAAGAPIVSTGVVTFTLSFDCADAGSVAADAIVDAHTSNGMKRDRIPVATVTRIRPSTRRHLPVYRQNDPNLRDPMPGPYVVPGIVAATVVPPGAYTVIAPPFTA